MTSPRLSPLRLFSCRLLPLAALILALGLTAGSAAAQTQGRNNQGEQRTANRDVAADLSPYPDRIIKRPDYFEFTPMVSNHDPVNRHDGQWAGQDWDVDAWPRGWTADSAIRKFYAARIFTAQNIGAGAREVTLGPVFYTLSRLDQNRTLALLTTQAAAFAGSKAPVILRDHATGKAVGSYSPAGVQLF